jgi:hypothetical protein
LPFFPFPYDEAELAYVGGHLGAPTKTHKRYMTVAEFATCLVPVDPACPTLAKGQVMVSTTFYERGFGVPLHRFLRSLIQSNCLKLHHLTPSEILHLAAFMTLREAYIWIEPHLNLWNHFC